MNSIMFGEGYCLSGTFKLLHNECSNILKFRTKVGLWTRGPEAKGLPECQRFLPCRSGVLLFRHVEKFIHRNSGGGRVTEVSYHQSVHTIRFNFNVIVINWSH